MLYAQLRITERIMPVERPLGFGTYIKLRQGAGLQLAV